MINKSKLFLSLPILVGLFIILGANKKQNNADDLDYKTAISIAEKSFPENKLKRENYKLVKLENNIFEKGDVLTWKLTFKDKKLFSREGLIGKGGEIFIEVNLKDKQAKIIGYGE